MLLEAGWALLTHFPALTTVPTCSRRSAHIAGCTEEWMILPRFLQDLEHEFQSGGFIPYGLGRVEDWAAADSGNIVHSSNLAQITVTM